MRFLDFLSRKKEVAVVEKTPEQEINLEQVKARHSRRIDNLKGEMKVLSGDLLSIEEDTTVVENEKAKKSDKIVQRLTLLNHEVTIRENLISWL